MKIAEQTHHDLALIAKLIEDIPVAMLTTASDEGDWVSRPMAPLAFDAQGALWFFTDLRSEKLDHLGVANLSFSDERKSTYVSLSGRGELVKDSARNHQLWTAFAKPWFPDGPDSPHLALLKFIPHAAEYWDAPSSRTVRLVAMAVSAVRGQPSGLGEHGKLTSL